MRGWLKDDSVGIGSCGDGGHGGQRCAVEDDYGIAAAVRDEAELARGIESHAVGAVKPGDCAGQLAGLCIDHIHAAAVGEIKTVGRGVGEQVIPAALAADFPAINDFVRLLAGKQNRSGKKTAQQGRDNSGPGEKT